MTVPVLTPFPRPDATRRYSCGHNGVLCPVAKECLPLPCATGQDTPHPDAAIRHVVTGGESSTPNARGSTHVAVRTACG
ncbi:hypothetical protein [Microbacterium sp. YY-01]|uniref:hypothetical protein n=1 Tax=Microbacterium sp. YY-01 TaxID=3421634 RepID=UPI003D17E676